MRLDDLLIAISYISIPLQLAVSLCRHPRISKSETHVLVLIWLFSLFIFFCGAGHSLRCMGMQDTQTFRVVNFLTAIVSLATALYLPPNLKRVVEALDGLQDLKDLNEQTAESKRKVMTFMAFLCHEIRNPLFAITSSISFLEDERMNAEQERGLCLISQSAALMLRLVNDVLDIGKLEAGKLELEESPFDLLEMLDFITASSRAVSKQRHGDAVNFTVSIAPDVPRNVSGDWSRILQIFSNLLSNAIKFTEQGEINFNVSVHEQGHDDSVSEQDALHRFSYGIPEQIILKCTVIDTGIGISPERIDRMFLPYSQEKLSNYRKHGGTGLGLAIVSMLTNLMGGTIHISSEEGVGTTFVVFIPVHDVNTESTFCPVIQTKFLTTRDMRDRRNSKYDLETGLFSDVAKSPCTPSPLRASTSPSPLFQTQLQQQQQQKLPPVIRSNSRISLEDAPTGPRRSSKKADLAPFTLPPDVIVLVVDDNTMNRKLLGRMLNRFGITYKEACNGQEAVDVVKASRNVTNSLSDPYIGMVLMDLSMPVMDGYQAIKEIRRCLNNAKMPIVALTANALDEGRENALTAGATEFATKPILQEHLHAKCQAYLLSTTDAAAAAAAHANERAATMPTRVSATCLPDLLHDQSQKFLGLSSASDHGGGGGHQFHSRRGGGGDGDSDSDSASEQRGLWLL